MLFYNIRQIQKLAYASGFAFIGLTAIAPGVTQALSYVVTNLTDNGPGSLRQAIADANNQPGTDTITFDPELQGILNIDQTLLVTGNINLIGNGKGIITIYSKKEASIINFSESSNSYLSEISINGKRGISNSGVLVIDSALIHGNSSSGIHNLGRIYVKNTIFSNNGVGIYNDKGELSVDKSYFFSNHHDNSLYGGGISSLYAPIVSISNSTFYKNSQTYGGGVYLRGAINARFYNNTLIGNNASHGGAIMAEGASVEVINSTLIGNSAEQFGGAIGVSVEGSLSIGNSIVSGNIGRRGKEIFIDKFDIFSDGRASEFYSLGHNILGENNFSGIENAQPISTDKVPPSGFQSIFHPLSFNGGNGLTSLPIAGGPAINAGNNSLVPTDVLIDQNGNHRIQGIFVDIGAIEGTKSARDETAWGVTEIFVATMGYAPDNEGLQYWVDQIEGGSGWSLLTVAQSFFDQPLVQEQYPENNSDFLIKNLYQNIFDRMPDDEGYDYWSNELDSGRVQKNKIVITLIDGGWSNWRAINDMARFSNQVRVGLAFAKEQKKLGILYSQISADQQLELRQIGEIILQDVSADPVTLYQAIAKIADLLKPLSTQ